MFSVLNNFVKPFTGMPTTDRKVISMVIINKALDLQQTEGLAIDNP